MQWEDRIFDGGGVEAGVAKTPTRQLVTEWIIGMYKVISKQMNFVLGEVN